MKDALIPQFKAVSGWIIVVSAKLLGYILVEYLKLILRFLSKISEKLAFRSTVTNYLFFGNFVI